MDMFARASLAKLRFTSARGVISHEDLWDMPLRDDGDGYSLNSLAKGLSRAVKAFEEEDFVGEIKKKSTDDELRLEIIKAVIEHRVSAKEAAEKAAATRSKKARIKELIAKKQDEDLEGKSVEELTGLLEEL